jgi:hypothetical protein
MRRLIALLVGVFTLGLAAGILLAEWYEWRESQRQLELLAQVEEADGRGGAR